MPLGYANPATLTNCTVESCSVYTSFYNYRIDLGANIAFLVCFSILLLVYLVIWITKRRCHLFAVAMILGLVIEIVGYASRIWSYYNQWVENAYLIQLICITLAPALFSAGIYLCLAWIAIIYGGENSRIKPIKYTVIFIPCDAASLLLQMIGGIIAAIGLDELSLTLLDQGTYILTAGLAWQVFTLFCFLALCVDLGLRIRRRRRKLGDQAALSQDPRAITTRSSQLFLGFQLAIGLASILIFWRCVFRLVELNNGFSGPVTFKQGLFIGFEGVLVLVAAAVLAIMHPAICMGEAITKEVPRS
ncbi:parasitic phase-specific psp-1 [Lecanosticta acicola]|uniref:Parasitic phase-specific psp-1 n=1 Tax=Lecanosticta acicola TaxID=111012 RepID=A0AAI8YXX3_9PEZI|nr:parasitic phase-specific psp-1 [Lecanosticta acicola]